MAVITTDISCFPLDVREKIKSHFVAEEHAKMVVAKANQARLSQLYNDASRPGVTNSNFGPLEVVMDPFYRAYFSRTCEARERVHDDPDFYEWLKKQEEFRVKAAPSKIQVGYR